MKKILILFVISLNFAEAESQSVEPLFSKDFIKQTKWVDSIYNKLSLDQKIGQLFFVQATSKKKN